jgi:hypothetical protein
MHSNPRKGRTPKGLPMEGAAISTTVHTRNVDKDSRWNCRGCAHTGKPSGNPQVRRTGDPEVKQRARVVLLCWIGMWQRVLPQIRQRVCMSSMGSSLLCPELGLYTVQKQRGTDGNPLVSGIVRSKETLERLPTMRQRETWRMSGETV